ncbi:predicted protein [Arabidopsis lyrata subsp. lyrata]|uniref:Predicted protein n=1 Tax=Arabidopsis lyrata subsp. lyrata TaxID=81972 RepID=D7LJI9_ARALL|nr:predicted protein [Arabidopsis lyrata subsp. lyrata]
MPRKPPLVPHIQILTLCDQKQEKTDEGETGNDKKKQNKRRREKREARGGFYYGSMRVHTGSIPLPFPFYIDK